MHIVLKLQIEYRWPILYLEDFSTFIDKNRFELMGNILKTDVAVNSSESVQSMINQNINVYSPVLSVRNCSGSVTRAFFQNRRYLLSNGVSNCVAYSI